MTPSANVTPRTEVPVTMGRLEKERAENAALTCDAACNSVALNPVILAFGSEKKAEWLGIIHLATNTF
jgi:hypothetical protein